MQGSSSFSNASHRIQLLICLLIGFTAFLSGCIRPQSYHAPPKSSVFHYRYLTDKSQGYGSNYFRSANAYECYVEFDARGAMYRDRDGNPTELNAAVKLINSIKQPPGEGGTPRRIALYVFVHGWENNASEDAGNVWGFRRFLADIAAQENIPVIGIYMGWPGASLKGDPFLTFWNREPIADNVGQSADFHDALKKLLQTAKGESYDSPERSIAVVVGHSFGGIVLEHAATTLIEEQIHKTQPAVSNSPRVQVVSPADLFVLLNEAGAASIALPFLTQLKKGDARYTRTIDGQDRNYPLILSMTSVGDLATKFAYPGGELLSINRPKTEALSPADDFGQTSTLPYNLLTAANMVALQSHQIAPLTQRNSRCDDGDDIRIPLSDRRSYCMKPLETSSSRNHTPYWIMQLPQAFVPDHTSIFRENLLKLLEDVLLHEQLMHSEGAASPLTLTLGSQH